MGLTLREGSGITSVKKLQRIKLQARLVKNQLKKCLNKTLKLKKT